MIKTNHKMKYDYEDSQYYLTPNCITEELPISDNDLSDAFGRDNESVEKEIRYLCRRVYNFMFSHNYPENHQWLKYKIYKNAREERYFLKEAMKSFIFGAYESDMDRNDYVDKTDSYPKDVYYNLKNARLVGLNVYKGEIPKGDY